MPWALGETAETLSPGRIGLGAGAAGLLPPIQPAEGLAVGQLWVAVGVLEGTELRLDYVLPATVHGAAKIRFLQRDRWALAATGGLGVHAVPAFAGLETTSSTPFASAGLIASRRDDGFRPYGAVKAIVPYVLGEYPGATLWLSGVAGVELGRGWLRFGPEAGVVVPTDHSRDWLLQVAFSVRRR